jgi:hypothetical protein
VRILKRRGGGIPAPVVLDLHSTLLQRPGAVQRDEFAPVSPHVPPLHDAVFATH